MTVSYVEPESLAATATVAGEETTKVSGLEIRESLLLPSKDKEQTVVPGLLLGDVITAIDGDPMYEPQRAAVRLLDIAKRGGDVAVSISVRRGLPNPYTSHPRLDLYVGSLSPHKMATFACTICHEGQGSATDFEWASHTPNTEKDRGEWTREYGWFDNHHWIYPMYPKRFAESACLKCHHDVVELQASDRYPDAPAPKVVRGYDLVRKYGCYGCHEINGYDAGRSIGPDLRLEPNYFAAAQQLQALEGENLTSQQAEWAAALVEHPELNDVRHLLYESLASDQASETPVLGTYTHAVVTPLFKDVESPGKLRKSGPALRYVGKKLDSAFLYDWIREPKHFRPGTRMPQFFGLHKHNQGEEQAPKYEPIEIASTVAYLKHYSQPFDYLPAPEAVTNVTAPQLAEFEANHAEQFERGRRRFQTRGCLACHTHDAFPDAKAMNSPTHIVQGPDLSGVGTKFSPDRNPDGPKWLYSWVKEPTKYHVRTVMPDLFLDEIAEKDAAGKLTGEVTDPAEDIVLYLLAASRTDWQPADGTVVDPLSLSDETLDELALDYLKDAFYEVTAERYLAEGIPQNLANSLKGAERELVVSEGSPHSKEKKLLYVGKKTIAKYGCYGCHDIPGFEDAKPIGTTMADWGRKDPSKLAFEHVTHYLEPQHGGGAHAAGHGDAAGGGHAESDDPIPDYYMHQIEMGHRAGFAYQKLREPRSYDYHKTANKRYNERLRMPQFPFDVGEREAVITFLLGLVAEPPADKYVYHPNERMRAIIDGKVVLEKYNCGGCHILEAERWDLEYKPGEFGPQLVATTPYPFEATPIATDELAKTMVEDRRGKRTGSIVGLPTIADDGLPLVTDIDEVPLDNGEEYELSELSFPFTLYEPTALDGEVYEVGRAPVLVFPEQLKNKYGTRGGYLTKYLLPHVTRYEKELNPQAKGSEALSWLPPPLLGEGQKVQPDWLHNFLLEPYPIRPAVVLRMPRFNMTADEATKLVGYFAAIDSANFPYEHSLRRSADHLAERDAEYRAKLENEPDAESGVRLEHAFKNIVINKEYCTKCHMVGDFVPDQTDRAMGPNLGMVYQRLRPEYLRNWIANPKQFLPYTAMPVNIAYDKPLDQKLYHGTSSEQLDAVTDVLMNFDLYSKQQSSVTAVVNELYPKPEEADAATVPQAAAAPAELEPATN